MAELIYIVGVLTGIGYLLNKSSNFLILFILILVFEIKDIYSYF